MAEIDSDAKYPQSVKDELVRGFEELEIAYHKALQRSPETADQCKIAYDVAESIRLCIGRLCGAIYSGDVGPVSIDHVDESYFALCNGVEQFDEMPDVEKARFNVGQSTTFFGVRATNMAIAIRDSGNLHRALLQECSTHTTLWGGSAQLRELHPEPWFSIDGVLKLKKSIASARPNWDESTASKLNTESSDEATDAASSGASTHPLTGESPDSYLNEFQLAIMEQQRRSGGIPEYAQRELLRWWIEMSPTDKDWHRIAPIRSTNSADRVKEQVFKRGLSCFLAMRGFLKCRCHARFSTAEPGTKVIECVVDWGGMGQTCEEAVRETLQNQNLWPSSWANDGNGLNFKAFPYAFWNSKGGCIFNLTGSVESQIERHLKEFPNLLKWSPKVHFCDIDGEVVEGRSQPLDYWLNGGQYGSLIEYPFGRSDSSEADLAEGADRPRAKASGKYPSGDELDETAATRFMTDGKFLTVVECGRIHFPEFATKHKDSKYLQKRLHEAATGKGTYFPWNQISVERKWTLIGGQKRWVHAEGDILRIRSKIEP